MVEVGSSVSSQKPKTRGTMQRLGKNNGKYAGECIDIHQVLREIEPLAVATGWERDPVIISENNTLPAFRRVVSNPRRQVYISSGIHGYESAGPLSVLNLFTEKH